MPLKSPFPDLVIPETNIVHHIFPPDQPVSDRPQWIDAKDPNHSLSPAQALSFAKQFACALDHQQVPRNTVILLVCPNHIFIPAIYYGIVGSGRVFSGVSPASTSSELTHLMKVACPELTIVHPSLLTMVLDASQAAGINHAKIFQFSDRPTSTPQGSTSDLRSILPSPWKAKSYDWLDLRGKASKDTTAAINFSSGTTGLPKGVSISHHNIVANLEQISFITRLDTRRATNARWVGFLPMYHAYGQLYSCLMCILLNNPVYIMSKFDFIDLLQTIQNYRLTTIHLVPPVLKMLADRPEPAQYDLSSVQDVLCGAAPLSRDLRDRIRARFGIIIREGYGMTELTCAAMQTPIRLAQEGTNSIGVLLPNTKCKLLTAEGDEAADGQPGEVYIHGPQVFQSYWFNEMATKESKTLDGWLKTGDIAITRHAEFWIVDRKKELIKVNGLQVSPTELEAILGENSHVSDAAVVGVATERGEAPRAYVTIQDEAKDHITEEQLVDWVAPRVAGHKWLTAGVVIVDRIPRLASGKIDRKTIRGWTKGEISLDTRSKL